MKKQTSQKGFLEMSFEFILQYLITKLRVQQAKSLTYARN